MTVSRHYDLGLHGWHWHRALPPVWRDGLEQVAHGGYHPRQRLQPDDAMLGVQEDSAGDFVLLPAHGLLLMACCPLPITGYPLPVASFTSCGNNSIKPISERCP